jgi:hypothetical protein
MSKPKTNEELITSIKKMNKIARENFAQNRGFLNSAEYIKFLSGLPLKMNNKPTPKTKLVKSIKSKVVVHVVDILDVSGSMDFSGNSRRLTKGSKLAIALEGINQGVNDLVKEKLVDYTYSLVTFSNHTDIKQVVNQKNPSEVSELKAFADGGTALYDAIGLTLKTLNSIKKEGDKVLVNIYTDGGENASKTYTKEIISSLIKEYEKLGFTVTFIGTIQDTKAAIINLNINSSNTLSYDGTAKGLSKTMSVTNSMRSVYASNVASGQNVSTGFYKTLNNK